MANNRGRTIKLNPVDEGQVTDHPARANLEAIMDQKLFHQRIRSERSSAYWFAASLWGVTGLVLGGILGVFLTMMVQTGSVPFIRDNIIAGSAIDAARHSVDSRNSRLPGPDDPTPSQQQP
ncbi:MAG: hypothetical protein QM759_11870 [Terricaulis sp.]